MTQSSRPETAKRMERTRLLTVHVLKRVVGVLVVPALVMILGGAVAPNPDGVLLVALVCMGVANNYTQCGSASDSALPDGMPRASGPDLEPT